MSNNVLLPEVIFCIIAPVILFQSLSLNKLKLFLTSKFVIATIFYIVFVLISYLYTLKNCAFGEFLASCYAFGILLLVYLNIYESNDSEKVIKMLVFSGVIAAIFSIIGYIAGTYFNLSFFNTFYKAYPLTGDTFRGHGLIRGPMIAADLIMIALLLQLPRIKSENNHNQLNKIFFVILTIGGVLTLTKSIIIVIGLILIFYSGKFIINSNLTRALGIMTILFYIFTSHFLIKKNDDLFYKNFASSPYSSNTYYALNDKLLLVPTIYSTQKYISLIAGIENFPFGIGGNCHMQFAKDLYKKGYIKANVSLTSHSTYFGVFGEMGLFGLISVIFLYWTGLITAIKIENKSLISCIVFIILSGLTIDNMNLRHHWILFGILLGSVFIKFENKVVK